MNQYRNGFDDKFSLGTRRTVTRQVECSEQSFFLDTRKRPQLDVNFSYAGGTMFLCLFVGDIENTQSDRQFVHGVQSIRRAGENRLLRARLFSESARAVHEVRGNSFLALALIPFESSCGKSLS